MTSGQSPSDHRDAVTVRPYQDVAHGREGEVGAAIDAIFFEASSVQSFADEAVRQSFHWRWLGRYLAEEPERAFVAVDREGVVCGYLIGSLADSARREAFRELPYFAAFAHLMPDYPAHLHINVAADRRGRGVGARLIAAFAAYAHHNNAPGMHIVTGAGLRNVRFYRRLGFAVVGETAYKGGTAVMLGAKLPL